MSHGSPVSTASQAYRRDIDGLRAVAVSLVVLYHAGVPMLPGGFTGVDVFFVISGFLITRIIHTEQQCGSFSIARFYVRRAKRILPALFTVLLGTWILGLLAFLPAELIELGRQIVATALFASNLLFWSQVDYFDTAAELKPLLHTWSLAIEEQFYLLWPLALLVVARWKVDLRRFTWTVVSLSFVASCWAAVDSPAAGFYLLPARAWELLLGGLLAIRAIPSISARWACNAMSIIGLLLIVAGAFLLDRTSPFPGWNALLPCVGAAFLIHAGERALCNRLLLANPVMVFIGLISYSLYLWHWPLLSVLRTINLGEITRAEAIVTVLLSVVLAALTWKFIEQPFRRPSVTLGARSMLLRYGAVTAVFIAFGAVSIAARGFTTRVPQSAVEAQTARTDINPRRGGCHVETEVITLPDNGCVTQPLKTPEKGTVVIWGDSHADAVAPGVVMRLSEAGYAVRQISKTSCPPLLDVQLLIDGRRYDECGIFNRVVLDRLIADRGIVGVFLAARWPAYLEHTAFGANEADTTRARFLLGSNRGELPTSAQSRAILRDSLGEMLDALAAAGKRTVVIGAVPESWFDVPSCVAKRRMTSMMTFDCGRNEGAGRKRGEGADTVLAAAVVGRPSACLLLPRDAMCDAQTCRIERADGYPLYYDNNHLSTVGAAWLMDQIAWRECIEPKPLSGSVNSLPAGSFPAEPQRR